MLTRMTTAEAVIDTFNVTPAAQDMYHSWIQDPGRTKVVEHVLAHHTKTVYDADPSVVAKVCRTTKHALGDVRKRVAEAVDPIDKWNPAFAFTHVLHYATEKVGRLLTWQEFFEFIQADPKANEMLWTPSLEEINRLVFGDRWSWREVNSAVRWRVGNSYYSFLREVFAISHWRAIGLDVQVHPLADALFRVDAWYDRTIVCLYVQNARYRDGGRGRKRPPQELLRGADPAFRFVPIRLEKATRFGEVLLPTIDQVHDAAMLIDPRYKHQAGSRSI